MVMREPVRGNHRQSWNSRHSASRQSCFLKAKFLLRQSCSLMSPRRRPRWRATTNGPVTRDDLTSVARAAVGPRAENDTCVKIMINVGPGAARGRALLQRSTRRVSNAFHDSAGCAQEKVVKPCLAPGLPMEDGTILMSSGSCSRGGWCPGPGAPAASSVRGQPAASARATPGPG